MRAQIVASALLLSITIVSTPSAVFAVSGTLTPAYGPPLAVQMSQSDVGGTPDPTAAVNLSQNTELDAAYGYVAGGVLYLFFSGSQFFQYQLEGGGISHWLPFDVFIDCAPGGQHQLLANNPTVEALTFDLGKMTGLTFDVGFAADYWLSLGGDPGSQWPYIAGYYATLPTGGGGSGAYLGRTQPGPPGVLAGGTNPFNIQVTLDDSNKLGLGAGCGLAASPGVQTGIEWAIPLAAIGNPTGCIRVTAFFSSVDHSQISNQVMGPLPPGTCALTPAAATDFSAIPGDQFVTICPGATPTRSETWGKLKTFYR